MNNDASYERVAEILKGYTQGQIDIPDYNGDTKEIFLARTDDGGAKAMLWPSEYRVEYYGGQWGSYEHLDDEIDSLLSRHGLTLQCLSGKLDVWRRIVKAD